MAKKENNDALLGALLVGLLWLGALAIRLLWLIGTLGAAYLYKQYQLRKLKSEAQALLEEGLIGAHQDWLPVHQDCKRELMLARHALYQRDFDTARQRYQKVAYRLKFLSQAEKDLLREEVAVFAGKDPLYLDILSRIQQILGLYPGILQSELITRSQVDKPLMTYVLYYADARGEVVRSKKGRSYVLTLPPGRAATARADGKNDPDPPLPYRPQIENRK